MSVAATIPGRRSRRARLGGVAALLFAALAGCGESTPLSGSAVRLDAAPGDPASFGELGPFRFVERSGRMVSREDVLGKPAVFAFFFTRCNGPCPVLTANMRRAQEELEGTDARLVSITVDPAFDTPEVLAEYAERFTADPQRWWFLTGPEEEIYSFMRESFALAVERSELPADDDVMGMAVTHATRLVAVDARGHIRGYYDGETEEGRRAAVARVRALAGVARSSLPKLNASLNATAGVLLLLGYGAIRRGRRLLHARLMRTAFAVSACFLACYLYYHFVVIPAQGGPVRFAAEGALRYLYLVLLATHVVLAALLVPFVLRVLWLAHQQRFEAHRRLARIVFPVWVYVSASGVLVYLFLYPWNPGLE